MRKEIISKLEGKEILNTEKRSNKKLAHPEITESKEINEMIDNANRTYLATDWHLWKLNKATRKIEKGKRFKAVMQQIEMLKEDDLLIFLGDLADDEFEDREALAEVLNKKKKKKIMILGNNDLLEKEYYEKYFDKVVEALQYGEILLTHFPIANLEEGINIHGHLHGGGTYFENCPRSIDCFTSGRFKRLEEVVNKFNRR